MFQHFFSPFRTLTSLSHIGRPCSIHVALRAGHWAIFDDLLDQLVDDMNTPAAFIRYCLKRFYDGYDVIVHGKRFRDQRYFFLLPFYYGQLDCLLIFLARFPMLHAEYHQLNVLRGKDVAREENDEPAMTAEEWILYTVECWMKKRKEICAWVKARVTEYMDLCVSKGNMTGSRNARACWEFLDSIQ